MSDLTEITTEALKKELDRRERSDQLQAIRQAIEDLRDFVPEWGYPVLDEKQGFGMDPPENTFGLFGRKPARDLLGVMRQLCEAAEVDFR